VAVRVLPVEILAASRLLMVMSSAPRGPLRYVMPAAWIRPKIASNSAVRNAEADVVPLEASRSAKSSVSPR